MHQPARLGAALTALVLLSALAAPAAGQGAPGKASLAVMPFTYSPDTVRNPGPLATVAIDQLKTSALTNKFITALVNTRKFDVVERSRVDELLAEMNLSETGLTDPARAVQAGKMIGADYFLMGEISLFTLNETWKEVPFTKRHQRTFTAQMIVDMRIVDTRTSKVVAADKGDVKWQKKTMHPSRFQDPQLPPDFIDALQRELCDQLVLKTIDGVYPIKIIAVSGDTISLNRGQGGGLEEGVFLDVFAVGDVLVDPDTGETLGAEEMKIGQIQVIQVLPRFSKATLIEASQPLAKGAICRRAEAQPSSRPAVERPRPPGWK